MAIINGIPIQVQLESTTNIKSINESSILGSGDLVIGGSSGLLGIHAIIPLSSGEKTSQLVNGRPASASSLLTNVISTSPFIPNQTIISSQLRINVSVGGSGGLAQIGIYSDLNGQPSRRLFASSNIDCSTTGIKTITTTFTFEAGTIYWIAYIGNASTFALNIIAAGQAVTLKISTNDDGSTIRNLGSLRVNQMFTDGLPSVLNPPYTDSFGNIPLIWITKA